MNEPGSGIWPWLAGFRNTDARQSTLYKPERRFLKYHGGGSFIDRNSSTASIQGIFSQGTARLSIGRLVNRHVQAQREPKPMRAQGHGEAPPGRHCLKQPMPPAVTVSFQPDRPSVHHTPLSRKDKTPPISGFCYLNYSYIPLLPLRMNPKLC